MSEAVSSDALATEMRGGHWLTVAVSQRVASRLGAALGRRGATPNAISVGNLIVGVGCSVLALLLLDHSRPAAAVIGLVGWQLAYLLDCADGQLARATGQGSPQGMIVDLLCDYAAQAAVATTIVAACSSALPAGMAGTAVSGALVGGLLVNVYVSAMYTGVSGYAVHSDGAKHSGANVVLAVARTVVRDYPAHLIVFCAAIAISAEVTLTVTAFYAVINTAFLVARVRSLIQETNANRA